MKNHSPFFLLFCFITVAFAQNNVIMPLNVGQYWEYVNPAYPQDTMRLEISGDSTILYQNNSYQVYFWHWQGTDVKWLMRNQTDGLWAFGYVEPGNSLIDPELLLKYPATPGDTWQNRWSLVGTPVTVTCLVTDSTIQTPAGTFSCYGYHAPWSSEKTGAHPFSPFFASATGPESGPLAEGVRDTLPDGMYLYFAPNIGYVMENEKMNDTLSNQIILVNTGMLSAVATPTPVAGLTVTLQQNYPNPFNPVTDIAYRIPEADRVELAVYNLLGERVKTLVNRRQAAGEYRVPWNGTDDYGRAVASGVYLYRLTAGKFVLSRKMLLLR